MKEYNRFAEINMNRLLQGANYPSSLKKGFKMKLSKLKPVISFSLLYFPLTLKNTRMKHRAGSNEGPRNGTWQ